MKKIILFGLLMMFLVGCGSEPIGSNDEILFQEINENGDNIVKMNKNIITINQNLDTINQNLVILNENLKTVDANCRTS